MLVAEEIKLYGQSYVAKIGADSPDKYFVYDDFNQVVGITKHTDSGYHAVDDPDPLSEVSLHEAIYNVVAYEPRWHFEGRISQIRKIAKTYAAYLGELNHAN